MKLSHSLISHSYSKMAYQRRLPSLFLALMLCLPPWPASGDSGAFMHLTYKMDKCVDDCRYYQDGEYFWCHTKYGWSYCSPRADVTYKGVKCRADHKCGNYGNVKTWCYTTYNDDYDYCGIVIPRLCGVSQYTYNLEMCIGDCQYSPKDRYFWCRTRKSWGYCSPMEGFTYKGQPCRSDHKCGAYGYSYSWCYTTDNNNYDYCGLNYPRQTCQNLNFIASRVKRATYPNIVCIENGKRFISEQTDKLMDKIKNELRKDAEDLIDSYKCVALGSKSRTVLNTKKLRIDLQATFSRGGQLYYNLQIQQNCPRGSGQSTSLAQILVPADTSDSDIQYAFKLSITLKQKITIERCSSSSS